ncbi:sensor histidine kinase [Ensifer sp. MJa1]|uniref:sensor histidine kinase n=1 Tax=Ensifer sp. MJa1 TaxID=2919888 RepID=UPI003008F918
MDSARNNARPATRIYSLDLRRSATFRNLLSSFRRLRLETQFIIIATFVVLTLMITLAILATNRLEKTVLNSVGSLGAGYMEAFVAPLISKQDIERGRLQPEVEEKLKALLDNSALGFLELRIWQPDGSIMYSTSGLAVAENVVFGELWRALSGETVVGRDEQSHQFATGRQSGMAIEVYAPLVRDETGKVVLVGEFYERPDVLMAELSAAWRSTISTVLLVTVPMLALLFMIVRSGSRVIDKQHDAIRRSLMRAVELSNQNRRLRSAAESARLEAGKLNEMILNQIGSDLHDGPVQLLTLLKLKLSDIADPVATDDTREPMRHQEVERLVSTVTTVLEDLRNISSDLVLPELDDMPLTDTIQLAVSRHVDLTGRDIDIVGMIASQTVDPHLNICVYRFIQEALMNGERHAPGNRQHVRFATKRNRLVIRVVDVGSPPGETLHRSPSRSGIGTLTQKRRIRAFGGRMRTVRRRNGTVVTAILPLDHSTGVLDA